jgi:peptide-methionine (R)-S-oxide reductase
MNRRHFFFGLGGLLVAPTVYLRVSASDGGAEMQRPYEVVRSEEEWRRLLTDAEFYVLREEGTERPWTSALNNEKRPGIYICAGCEQPLFSSEQKFDSGTGWPSFFDTLEGAIGTKKDFKLLLPRTEYHCSRCGGHHGHVFKDGPPPTGLRYCNNGVALKFIPERT